MRAQLVLAGVLGGCAAACGILDPGSGTLQVSVATTGGDSDLDGYVVTVRGGDPQAIGPNDTVVFRGVPDGVRDVELTGLATNCTVSGDNPRPVEVRRDETVSLAFAVGCVATGVQVSITTVGIDLDPDGYEVLVDGVPRASVAVLGTAIITRLDAGAHAVALSGLAPNCTDADLTPRSVTVAPGETVPVSFVVTCVALTGILRLTTATSGIDLDGNGYTIHVDGGPPMALGINATTNIAQLAGGDHTVRVDDVAGNCAVAGENPRTLTVTTGGLTRDTTRSTFQVICGAITGVIRAAVATTGLDLDIDGYTLMHVESGTSRFIGTNGTITLPGLAAGNHTLRLDGAAGNCAIGGENPRTLVVTTGGPVRDTARTTFSVTCVAVTASIQLTTVTSGTDLDPNGYAVRVDDGSLQALGVNAVLTIDGLPAGSHSVTLEGVSSNCTVAGPNPRTLVVSTGGNTRDTARTTFEGTCVAVDKITFARVEYSWWYYFDIPTIMVTFPDGSIVGPVTRGDNPAWSPNGTQLAFAEVVCPYYCNYNGLARQQADGSGFVRLTNDGSDRNPTWRPDGTRLAFTRGNTLYLINPDGSGSTPLTAAGWAAHPAWSPDGARIAFTCEVVSGNQDICVVNADGTGLTRLSSDAARDARPAWKPDGSQIVFSTTRYTGNHELALMAPDGSGVTRVSPGTSGIQPAWSPDGTRIVFSAYQCDIYTGCTVLGLSLINADGTGLTRITSGRDHVPVWRP